VVPDEVPDEVLDVLPVCADVLSEEVAVEAVEDFCVDDDESADSSCVLTKETSMSPVAATGVVSITTISFTT